MSTSQHSDRIVIAGGTGTLGGACAEKFAALGYEVVILSRSQGKHRNYRIVQWNPGEGTIEDRSVVEGARAVINFTGTPLDGNRWTSSYKQKLYDSRVLPARLLNTLISEAANPPEVYIGSSAIGIYGDTGEGPVTESFPTETAGFVAELGHAWEDAQFAGSDATRSVVFRVAVVFDGASGFLKQLALPAMFGIYPYFGSGKQYLSWVHIDDLVSAVVWAVENSIAGGIYNLSAPDARPAKKVMRVMRTAKGGPGLLISLPRWAANIILGEMAGLLFAGANVVPERLLASDFEFRYDKLDEGLRAALNPQKPR